MVIALRTTLGHIRCLLCGNRAARGWQCLVTVDLRIRHHVTPTPAAVAAGDLYPYIALGAFSDLPQFLLDKFFLALSLGQPSRLFGSLPGLLLQSPAFGFSLCRSR